MAMSLFFNQANMPLDARSVLAWLKLVYLATLT